MTAACVCAEINTRHCPVHGQGETTAAKCPNCHGTGNTRFGVCAYCKGTGRAQ